MVLSRSEDAHGLECVEARVVASKAGANFELVTRNTGLLNESIGAHWWKGHSKRSRENGASKPWVRRVAASTLASPLLPINCFRDSLIQLRIPLPIALLMHSVIE